MHHVLFTQCDTLSVNICTPVAFVTFRYISSCRLDRTQFTLTGKRVSEVLNEVCDIIFSDCQYYKKNMAKYTHLLIYMFNL